LGLEAIKVVKDSFLKKVKKCCHESYNRLQRMKDRMVYFAKQFLPIGLLIIIIPKKRSVISAR
jgi:hypothetical protein